MEVGRRGFLAAVCLSASATTGCVDRLSGLGEDPPEYAPWIPGGSGGFSYFDVSDIREQENLSTGAITGLSALSSAGVDTGSVGSMVTIDGRRALAAMGTFDTEAVRQDVTDGGFSESGSHGGYSVYRRDGDEERFLGVASDAVVLSVSDGFLREVIDARDGEGPRLLEDSFFETLVNELEQGTRVRGGMSSGGDIQGEMANGLRVRVDGSSAEVLGVIVFENAAVAADAESEGAPREYARRVTVLEDADVELDARVMRLRNTVDVGRL